MMYRTLYLLLFPFLFSCANPEEKKSQEETLKELHIQGYAQGTTYSIKYLDNTARDYQPAIDSILRAIDLSMSTWVDSSIINKINNGPAGIYQVDTLFREVFELSVKISEESGGAFDASLAPVIYQWGIGFDNPQKLSKEEVDSLMQFTGYDKFELDRLILTKKIDQAKLDFNGIAQGYSVDKIAEFIEAKGMDHYMIELGGEVRARGKNSREMFWRIGIDKPMGLNEDRELQAVISLNDNSLATSGNYRKFYEVDGERFPHTISPFTGFPVKHQLLSASLVMDDCAAADAWATAIMVMGFEKARELLQKKAELKAYLIYSEEGEYKSYLTENLKEQIEIIQ